MKVILLEDVKKVGKRNEVVEVSQGYANNFLFKQKLAVEADKPAMRALKKRVASEEASYEAEIQAANDLKSELEAKEFVFKLKSGKNGQVFGSISSKQINEELKKQGYKIDKRGILSDPINHLGYDKVKIELHKEVVAEIKVKVEEK